MKTSKTTKTIHGPGPRHSLEEIPAALWILDPWTGRFLAANRAACWQAGCSCRQLLKLKFRDLCPDLAKPTPAANAELRRRDGTRLPVKIATRKIQLAGQPALLATVQEHSWMMWLVRGVTLGGLKWRQHRARACGRIRNQSCSCQPADDRPVVGKLGNQLVAPGKFKA